MLPSAGNFLAIRFPDSEGRRAADADAFLTQRGLVLRAIRAYGMPEFLRLTVGSQEANELVVAAIADFLRGADA